MSVNFIPEPLVITASLIYQNLVTIERFAIANQCSQFSDSESRSKFLSTYAQTLWSRVSTAETQELLKSLVSSFDVGLGCAAISGYVKARQEAIKPVLPRLILYPEQKKIPGPRFYRRIETLFLSHGLHPYAVEPGETALYVYCEEGLYTLSPGDTAGFRLDMTM